MGYLEERNPLHAMWLPEWFLNQHMHIRRNLELNQFRLTTNFDTHQTLIDILNENFEINSSTRAIQRSMSQLYELPVSRTCPQAGIPDNYCLCGKHTVIDPDQHWVRKAAEVIVDHLNNLLKPTGRKKFTFFCLFSLLTLLIARSLSQNNSEVC